MKFKLARSVNAEPEPETEIEVRLELVYDGDVNLEVKVDGRWRLAAWIEPHGGVHVVRSTMMPKGFSSTT